jgi:DNA-directed RNA polymerase specialized sigma24 family protein
VRLWEVATGREVHRFTGHQPAADPVSEAESREFKEHIDACLYKLDRNAREVISLSFFLGSTLREIAELLYQVANRTTIIRVHRKIKGILEVLKRCLKAGGEVKP